MPVILLYFVKLSCSLGLVWLFYRLVLHNLTFYTWNRWYLLGYGLLSLAIPLVDIGPIRGEDPAHQPLLIQFIPVIDKADAAALPAAGHHFTWDSWYFLLLCFGLGSCFLLVRFAIRWNSLRRMRQKAELLEEGPIRIFRVQAPIAPFSFGNAIYVNPDQHGEKEWEEIILHEYVHIRQRHTRDILFAEFLLIVNWYNPFSWLIRYSIRQNLEFIADRAVVENGCDKKGYQYHLLKVVGQDRYRLANNFNFSSLKKRIIMMNKIRSARLHLLRFLFVLPLLTILLVAFRDRLPLHHTPVPAPAAAIRHATSPILKTPHQSSPRSTAQAAPPAPRMTPRRAITDTLPRQRDTTPLDRRKVLWIIDGVPRPKGWIGMDSIKPQEIARMYIYKGDEAKDLYGERGSDGVISIITRSGQKGMFITPNIIVSNGGSAPLYIVDGVMKEQGIGDLNPVDIESITILKAEAGKAIYGDKAANGVILITTKNAKRQHTQVTLKSTDADGNTITGTADTVKTPLGTIYAAPKTPIY